MDDNTQTIPTESAVGFPSYIWKLCRLYIFRAEMIVFGSIFLLLLLIYLESNNKWSRRVLDRMSIRNDTTDHWMDVRQQSAAFAIIGRRPQMEDRFVIDENIDNNTGISFFAVFDGHGGKFAADFAKDILVKNIYNQIIEANKLLRNNSNQLMENFTHETYSEYDTRDHLRRKMNLKKNHANDKDNNDQLARLNAKCYIENGTINFGKIITDEILAVDHQLVNEAKVINNTAGTTALIAIIQGSKLVVGNVGDSRGVMCDSQGLAVPLSFDHKPEKDREWKRIHDAGGFIAFKGVWRVGGILAMSRSMGDYELKENNVVISKPDILKFDLKDNRPKFLILATDGLWDIFHNQAACDFLAEHITEEDFGAKSLVMESYKRGSKDNITILIIVFRKGHYYIRHCKKFFKPKK